MAPYKNERYHLEQFRGAEPPPEHMMKFFNVTHSSLRAVVECCFGILKSRFPILKRLPRYDVKQQSHFVIALCCVHNFIRLYGKDDELSAQDGFLNEVRSGTPDYNVGLLDFTQQSVNYMGEQRDRIVVSLDAVHGVDPEDDEVAA